MDGSTASKPLVYDVLNAHTNASKAGNFETPIVRQRGKMDKRDCEKWFKLYMEA